MTNSNKKIDLEKYWENVNVQALSHVVREKESSNDSAAYTVLNGGDHIHVSAIPGDAWKHPGKEYKFPALSSAAGAYQAIFSTWEEERIKWGLEDFSPHNQDLFFVARLIYRKVIDYIVAGNFEATVEGLRKEWTSLPGAGESNASWTMQKAKDVYAAYGGLFSYIPATTSTIGTGVGMSEVTHTPTPIPSLTNGKAPMPILALLTAFGPLISSLIPQVAKILNPQGEATKTAQGLATAQLVLDTITKAAGATNVQDAVEKLQSSPQVVQDVQKQLVNDPQIMQLLEVGGGIEKARDFSIKIQESDKPFWKNPTFAVTCLLLPLIYIITICVLWGREDSTYFGSGFTAETKSGFIQLIVGMVLGGIVGVWFGTTFTSKQKDDTIQTLSKSS